jgi:AcrR family transcriptional regulator
VQVAATLLKERILREPLRLFSPKGYLSTSIKDILGAAETFKGGFNNHFARDSQYILELLQLFFKERRQ